MRLFLFLGCLFSLPAWAEGFFAPYSPNRWAASRESAPAYVETAMESLRLRIELAQERIDGARPELARLAARLSAIGEGLSARGRSNSALFYLEASKAVQELPERFQLPEWLDAVEKERVKFLSESRELVIPTLAEDRSNHVQVGEVLEARVDSYRDWLLFVERMNGSPSWFFSAEDLQSQESFNDRLLKSALPLCDMGQQKPQGLKLICLNPDSEQFLQRGRRSYFLNYSFLFASVSPQWPLQGDPASSTLLEYRRRGADKLTAEISHASPYFNLYEDTEVISQMLDGSRTGEPLEVVLAFKPWYLLLRSLAPHYSAAHHRLTTYYGAFKGDWGSTRWEPAPSDYSCAKVLRDSLTPESRWDRPMSEGELLAEALRGPK